MVNPDVLTGYENTDHVEPIGELRAAVSIHPNTSTAAKFSAFAEVDRFHRLPKGLAAPRLDFHERNLLPPSHDEVDIAMPAAEPMRDELPAVTPHPAGGDTLAQQPQSLSLFRHERTVSPSPTMCGTGTARADSNERGA